MEIGDRKDKEKRETNSKKRRGEDKVNKAPYLWQSWMHVGSFRADGHLAVQEQQRYLEL